MLDFGKGFSRRAKYFEEYLNPRTANGIVDFIEMGIIPDIEGIYRDDLLEMRSQDICTSSRWGVDIACPCGPCRLHLVPSQRHPALYGCHLPDSPSGYPREGSEGLGEKC